MLERRPMSRSPWRRRTASLFAVSALLVALSPTIAPAAFANTGVPVVEDFEGMLPITTSSPGIFTFGSDAASNPQLSQVAAPDRPGAAADNHALDVVYTVGAYGGFSNNLSTPQDWSAYGGLSLLVKGNRPRPPVQDQNKDGGTHREHPEPWQALLT